MTTLAWFNAGTKSFSACDHVVATSYNVAASMLIAILPPSRPPDVSCTTGNQQKWPARTTPRVFRS